MRAFRMLLLAAALLAPTAPAAFAADDPTDSAHPAKTFIVDGSVVHDAGRLHNNVTNWGLIGSRPTMPSTFSHAPSARWPGAGGTDYLWAAGLWVGGTVLGEARVSTGQYEQEILATAHPLDVIYATTAGAPGGTRYPWTGADDDGDGLEDEDPLDGRDDDGDGLVDEDFAAAADQQFRCVMWDTTALAQTTWPDHAPLGLRVVQTSFQWTDPAAADFIGYEYAVTNIGAATVDGVHCALFADFDVGIPDVDLAGGWSGLVAHPSGVDVPVSLAWTRDNAAFDPVPGYMAFVLCGLVTDAAAGGPADPLGLWSLNLFSGNSAFAQGGDPTNDAERYQLLSTPGIDPNPPAYQQLDYRVLLSAPPVPALAPGETVVFRTALVAGADLDQLLLNAAEAVLTAVGRSYDRDGDPANGEEFAVPWLRPEDAPVPALGGRLVPAPAAGGADLAFAVQSAGGLPVAVVRRGSAGLPERRWEEVGAAGTVRDRDAGPWPRTYDLVGLAATGEIVLDTAEVAGPALLPLELQGSPNPFNPRLTVGFTLPAAGWARLAVLDVRGRVVRELFAGARAAGTDEVVWDGLDAAGRAVASGVYTVRLQTRASATQQRVTLLR